MASNNSSKYFFIKFCLFTYFGVVSADLTKYNPNSHEESISIIRDCIKRVIAKNQPCASAITVVSTEKNHEGTNDLIKFLNEELCYSFITRTYDNHDNLFIKYELYIINAKDINDLRIQLSKLSRDMLWNPKAMYIIRVADVNNIKDIFKKLNKYNIHKAVFINVENLTEIIVYTYDPFANDDCGKNVDVIKLGDCSSNAVISKTFTNYSVRAQHNPKVCNLRIALNENVPWTIFPNNPKYTTDGKAMLGLDQYILTTVASVENFDLNFTYVPDAAGRLGTVLKNGTSTGLLRYLQNNRADIASGGFILMRNRAERYDFLDGYDFANFIILTAGSRDDWKMVYKEFSVSTWMLIAVIFLFFTLFFIFINQLFSYTGRNGIVFKLWGYFFGNTSRMLARNMKLRRILACWIWFTFFISNFYSTGFYSLMTGKSQENSHVAHNEPLEYLLYKPCITDSFRILFKVNYNVSFDPNSVTGCEHKIENLHIVAANPDFFSVELKTNYLMHEWRYIDSEGNHQLEIWELPQSVPSPMAMFVSKGFTFRDQIQDHILRMTETGLTQHHLSLINSKATKALHMKIKDFKFLDLQRLQIAFFMLYAGLILASIVFIVEKIKM